MKKFHVHANACDFGIIEAEDQAFALTLAAQMAGYESIDHLEMMLEESHQFVVTEVDAGTDAKATATN